MNYSDPSSRTFSLLYTSLMLIVFCMIVGNFYGSSAEDSEHHEEIEVAGEFSYNNFFMPESSEFDDLKAEALFRVMKNHDLQLTMQIAGRDESEHEQMLALARAYSIQGYLLERGLPENSMQIWAGGSSREQLSVLFSKEEAWDEKG